MADDGSSAAHKDKAERRSLAPFGMVCISPAASDLTQPYTSHGDKDLVCSLLVWTHRIFRIVLGTPWRLIPVTGDNDAEWKLPLRFAGLRAHRSPYRHALAFFSLVADSQLGLAAAGDGFVLVAAGTGRIFSPREGWDRRRFWLLSCTCPSMFCGFNG